MTTIRRIDCAEARDRAPFFVLGALDARGAAEVRDHLATCTLEHPEFAELGGVVPYLAELVEPLDGGPALRERVLAIVAADARAQVRDDVAAERYIATFGPERRTPASAAPEATPQAAAEATPPASLAAPAPDRLGAETGPAVPTGLAPQPGIDGTRLDRKPELWVDESASPPAAGAPVALADRTRSRRMVSRWALPAAAALVIAVLGAWNINLQQQASDVARRAADLRTAIAVSADPTARVARLAGSGTEASVKGFAAFRPNGTGVLVIDGLAPAPAGQTYQAWYLNGGVATSAGLVPVESDGLALVTGLTPGGAFDTVALTLEPAGGRDQPTGAPLVVGKLGA